MMLKIVDIIGVIGTVVLALWLAIPSSVFLQPQSIHYRGNDVIFVRSTPFGFVLADWVTEVDLININEECTADGTAPYQVVLEDREKNRIADTVKYKTDPRLWRCLEQDGEKIIRHTWVVKLFGIIPLRKTEMVITIGV